MLFNNKSFIIFLFIFLPLQVKAEVSEQDLSNYFINNPYAREEEIESFAGKPHIVFKNKDNLVSLLKKTPYKKDNLIKYVDNNLKNDLSFAEAVLKEGLVSIGFFSEEIINNEALINIAVKNKGSDLQYATNKKKSDKDFVALAIRSDASSIKYANEELRLDRNFLLEMASSQPKICRHIDQKFEKDIEILTMCLKKEPTEIYDLGSWAISNKKLVIASIQGGSSLTYKDIQDENLKNDIDIQREAIKTATTVNEIDAVIKYIDSALLDDKKFILDVISNGRGSASGIIYKYVGSKVKNDKTIAKYAIIKSAINMEWMDSVILNDKHFMQDAIQSDTSGKIFASMFLPKEYRKDRNIALAAIKNNETSFFFVDKDLRADSNFFNDAIKENPKLNLMNIKKQQ